MGCFASLLWSFDFILKIGGLGTQWFDFFLDISVERLELFIVELFDGALDVADQLLLVFGGRIVVVNMLLDPVPKVLNRPQSQGESRKPRQQKVAKTMKIANSVQPGKHSFFSYPFIKGNETSLGISKTTYHVWCEFQSQSLSKNKVSEL